MGRIFFAVLIFIFAGNGFAATYYVRQDGLKTSKTGATIGCMNAADSMSVQTLERETFADRDVVIFCNDSAKSYTGTITIPSGGSDANNLITYRSETGQTAVVDGGQYGIVCTKSNVRIRGFEVKNTRSDGFGVYIHPGTADISHVYLRDMNVHNTTGDYGMFIGVPDGEEAYKLNNVYVYNSRFSHNTGTGLGIAGWSEVSAVEVHNSISHHNNIDDKGGDYQQGIAISSKRELFDDANWTVHTGTIYKRSVGNEPRYVSRRVIQAYVNDRELTENKGNYNYLSDGQWDYHNGNLYINIGENPNNIQIRSIPGYTHDILIRDCSVYGNYGDANLCVDDGAVRVTIDRCTISGEKLVGGSYGGEGIIVRAGVDTIISNSLIYNNDRDGIVLHEHSTGTSIHNVTVVDNGRDGVRLGKYNGGAVSLKNSIISGNARYGFSDSRGGYSVSEDFNLFYANVSANLHNINGGTIGSNSREADPLFINETIRDYHLLSISPCRDNGTDLGLKWDLDSLARPQGSATDIGAYEFTDAPRNSKPQPPQNLRIMEVRMGKEFASIF